MRRFTINKYFSRLMACLMLLALLISVLPAALATEAAPPAATESGQPVQETTVTESGSCGSTLNWTFAGGTLTITGSGAMTDFPENIMAPWYHLRDQILRVELPAGLTRVGSLAFYECSKITILTIPDSVTWIGSYAFARCSGIQMLNLGSGVSGIGESAFAECESITALRLPASLKTIGPRAFYRCAAIPTVTVPASVTEIGMSAFGYCEGLISANVYAQVQTIPEFLFYGCSRLVTVILPDALRDISKFSFRGCDQLSAVCYNGTEKSPEEIQEMINSDIPGFEATGNVTDTKPENIPTAGITHENTDGSITQENVSITETDDSTITQKTETTTHEDGSNASANVEINVTINGENGWNEAADAVEDALDDLTNISAATNPQKENVEVNIYINSSENINQEFIDKLADQNIKVTITTQDGSKWKIDTTQLDKDTMDGAYDLRYDLIEGPAALCAELGVAKCYLLRFQSDAVINAELLIRLDIGLAQQHATLMHRSGSQWNQYQTGVVDREGYAHLFLGAVESENEYCIAINLMETEQEALVPEEMLPAYGSPELVQPIQYEIVGTKSSWGMTFNQVTWIMIGFLGTTVLVVGIVMFSLNKRRLRMGYIPDLEDEDYE